jgi:putative phage-type endonuclease
MAATVLADTRNLTREDWLQARNQGIGGSDIPAILGLSNYRSAIDVWLEKTGQRQPEPVSSESAYWGTRLEDIVAEEFTIRNPGVKVNRRNAILQHSDVPYALANIDRECRFAEQGRGILEIKTSSAYASKEWDGEAVPLAAQAQVQWYLYVTGYAYAYVAALIGGQRYVQAPVTRDEQTIRNIAQVAETFWYCVTERIMPAVDGSAACSNTLKSLYPSATPGTTIDLPPTLAGLPATYDSITAQINRLEADKAEIENLIKADMGEAERAWLDGREVRWSNVTSQRLDSKRLKAAHPDLYDAFCTPSTTRRFEIRKEKTHGQ